MILIKIKPFFHKIGGKSIEQADFDNFEEEP